jgi:hypothetical protein
MPIASACFINAANLFMFPEAVNWDNNPVKGITREPLS